MVDAKGKGKDGKKHVIIIGGFPSASSKLRIPKKLRSTLFRPLATRDYFLTPTHTAGAGIGGVATAARLAKAGLQVTLLEKNDYSGGRCSLIHKDGFRFDQGPSFYLMPVSLAIHEEKLYVILNADIFIHFVLSSLCFSYYYP